MKFSQDLTDRLLVAFPEKVDVIQRSLQSGEVAPIIALLTPEICADRIARLAISDEIDIKSGYVGEQRREFLVDIMRDISYLL